MANRARAQQAKGSTHPALAAQEAGAKGQSLLAALRAHDPAARARAVRLGRHALADRLPLCSRHSRVVAPGVVYP